MVVIIERDETGRILKTEIASGKAQNSIATAAGSKSYATHTRWLDFLRKVFLPAGYPQSVSHDYLRYQILNALQAFCNSLASLLSSRATLEGFGVGDPSATATQALLLTVLQDVFSRLTTIFSAYFIGSSLYPEAKTYRLLADVMNDSATILETLSPLLIASGFPGIRVVGLCISSSLRALCGIAAGGSKAAITLHFASPINGSGDVGDLNAKDSSKETVLALLGMLFGTLIVPRLTTAWSTYSVLFLMVGLHLVINYLGVRSLVLRSLNRQRTAAAWMRYRNSGNSQVPSPTEMAKIERIFERPGVFRDPETSAIIGRCTIGSSISNITGGLPPPVQMLRIFDQERYLLWYDHQSLTLPTVLRGPPRLHICLKDGYTHQDQLKAWTHAAELSRIAAFGRTDDGDALNDPKDALAVVQTAYQQSVKHFPEFIEKLRNAEWNIIEGALMTGSPRAVVTSIENQPGNDDDDKKHR